MIHLLPSLKDTYVFLVDNLSVLNAKDLEWSKQHLPAAMIPESENTEEGTVAEPAIEPPKRGVSRAKKVSKC